MFDCVLDIAANYSLPPALIQAVMVAESGGKNPGRVEGNKNGSADLGVMQINTYWLNPKTKNNVLQHGITETELLTNDCTNIAVGAWILKQNIDQYGGSYIKALSAYNTGKPTGTVGQKYAIKVINIWSSMYEKN